MTYPWIFTAHVTSKKNKVIQWSDLPALLLVRELRCWISSRERLTTEGNSFSPWKLKLKFKLENNSCLYFLSFCCIFSVFVNAAPTSHPKVQLLEAKWRELHQVFVSFFVQLLFCLNQEKCTLGKHLPRPCIISARDLFRFMKHHFVLVNADDVLSFEITGEQNVQIKKEGFGCKPKKFGVGVKC